MKLIFTFLILLSHTVINATGMYGDTVPVTNKAAGVTVKNGVPAGTQPIRIRCGMVVNPASPLLIIDGLPYEFEELSKLNQSDILSVDILKDVIGATIYGCRAAKGIIIITTRSAYMKQFIIKDFLTGERLPFATVCFMSASDTLKMVADESGIVKTDKLRTADQYKAMVSSAGYKTLSTTVKGKEQELLLEKEVKKDNIVSVSPATNYPGKVSSVYPNPVQRNSVFNIELISEQDEMLQLTVFGLNGNRVLVQQQKVTKELNRFSVIADGGWSAGVYIVQLRNAKGNVVKNEKIIIQ